MLLTIHDRTTVYSHNEPGGGALARRTVAVSRLACPVSPGARTSYGFIVRTTEKRERSPEKRARRTTPLASC